MKSDYHEANVPMLHRLPWPPRDPPPDLIYTILLVPVALGLGVTSVAGPVYLASAIVLNAIFLKGAWDIWRRDETMAEADAYAVEKRVFRFRCPTCPAFGALLVDAACAPWGFA